MRKIKGALLLVFTLTAAPMIFIYTEPTEGNLLTACVLTALCGLGAKHYFTK